MSELSLRSLKMVQPEEQGVEGRAVRGPERLVGQRQGHWGAQWSVRWRGDGGCEGMWPLTPQFWQKIQIYTLRRFPEAQEGQSGDPHQDIASSHGLNPGATSTACEQLKRRLLQWRACCGLLIRNQRAEGVGEGKTVSRNSVSSKAVTQKWRRNEDLPR